MSNRRNRYLTASPAVRDDRDALREWRWRSYTDHLRDMGYDLDGGESADGHLRSAGSQPGEQAHTESPLPAR